MEESKAWPQFLVVLTLTISVFTTGLHTGWPAPSLPNLFSDEYPFDVSQEEGSYITIIGSIGNIVGGFIGYLILDRLGRRKSILSVAMPQFGSLTCFALSYQVMELLYVGRFLGGMGEGMSISFCLLYIGEISEPRIRGTLCTLVSIFLYFGVLYINIIGSYLNIRTTALTCLVFPTLFVLLFWKMPESPYYLLMTNREEEAVSALRFLRRKEKVDDELEKLKSDVNRQMSETSTFKDIFTIESNRKALIVMIGARFFQITTGNAAFNLYIQLLIKDATDAMDPTLGSTIVLIIQLVMTFISTFIVDKWGRKPLLLFSAIGCFVDLLLETVFFILQENTDVDVSGVSWLPLVLIMIQIVIYSLGLGVVVSVLQGEMFSASIKSKMTCLLNTAYAVFTLASTKFYQGTADGVGLTVPFASFALLTLLGVGFFYFYLPETKGKTLEEIQQRLKGKRK